MRRLTLVMLGVGAVLLAPASAFARVTEVMVVNPNPISVSVTSLLDMKISPSQNTVKIDPSQNEVKVTNTVDVTSHTDPYTAYVEVSPSAGGNSCTRITTPEGQRVRLDLGHFTTYSDPGSQAFVRYAVKIGSGVGRIMIQGVLLDDTGTSFPVSNGRAASAELGLHVMGSSNSAVQMGEVYAVYGCVQASSGQTPSGYVASAALSNDSTR